MKIEKRGNLPKEQKKEPITPWWLGKRAECPRCSTIVTLEIGDAPAHYTNFALLCPMKGCGAYIPVRPVYDRTGKIGG